MDAGRGRQFAGHAGERFAGFLPQRRLERVPQRDLFGRCEVSERGFFRCAELDDNAVRLFRGLEDGPERRAYFLFKIAGKRLYVIVQPANVAQQFKRERVPCRAGNVCRVHRAPLI